MPGPGHPGGEQGEQVRRQVEEVPQGVQHQGPGALQEGGAGALGQQDGSK